MLAHQRRATVYLCVEGCASMKNTWVGRLLLLLLPVVAAALWITSGRETLTKSRRFVETERVDSLFGDIVHEVHVERGPWLGYYVGLDLVGAATAAALAGLLIILLVRRFRRRPAEVRARKEGAG
jgi:Mg/Co/Ni transporter MgtE